ncbi:hypothetical protein ACFHWD_03510 [Clostridium sp. MT-14]|uniref:hypothetical protein n=1 Tax=Clostridium sp. MT-14 TaxID=3348360 RepID=UPI0035F31EF3
MRQTENILLLKGVIIKFDLKKYLEEIKPSMEIQNQNINDGCGLLENNICKGEKV